MDSPLSSNPRLSFRQRNPCVINTVRVLLLSLMSESSEESHVPSRRYSAYARLTVRARPDPSLFFFSYPSRRALIDGLDIVIESSRGFSESAGSGAPPRYNPTLLGLFRKKRENSGAPPSSGRGECETHGRGGSKKRARSIDVCSSLFFYPGDGLEDPSLTRSLNKFGEILWHFVFKVEYEGLLFVLDLQDNFCTQMLGLLVTIFL